MLQAGIVYTSQQHTRQAYDCLGRHAQIVRVFYCLQKAGGGMKPFTKPATTAHFLKAVSFFRLTPYMRPFPTTWGQRTVPTGTNAWPMY